MEKKVKKLKGKSDTPGIEKPLRPLLLFSSMSGQTKT